MVGCQTDRSAESELEKACRKVEDGFLLPRIQWKRYIASLIKYAFMGNLSRDQFLAFCLNLEIAKADLESKEMLRSFFEQFKQEGGVYNEFDLKIAGLFYCESTNKEKLKDFLLLMNPEKKEFIPKGLMESVLLKCMDLATTFTVRHISEIHEEAKKDIQSMSEATAELRKEAVKIWCPELSRQDVSPKAIDLSLIHICRCRRLLTCRSRWSPYH
eukprot:TRINITY_DN17665_c0_g1_i1.p1 TRINITY_DN17665_c0_g1~~TRINITY_DN17665_c0_g1_i1.p1  ORF type:complete len:215 (-),score=42.06 TRINITY_DN17665_c0_g1_i1:18-662(-)